jgi:hypothetical protein
MRRRHFRMLGNISCSLSLSVNVSVYEGIIFFFFTVKCYNVSTEKNVCRLLDIFGVNVATRCFVIARVNSANACRCDELCSIVARSLCVTGIYEQVWC